MGLEDIGNRHAGGLLDLGISIGKRNAEAGREPPTDRGFASPHHADQHDGAPSERCRKRRIVRCDTQTMGHASVVHRTFSQSHNLPQSIVRGNITPRPCPWLIMASTTWRPRGGAAPVFTKLYPRDKSRKFGSFIFRSWATTKRNAK